MKIWRCSQCDDGVRAPARMRRDDAKRYCLKCTAKTGKLVERVCPSAQAERKRREAERREAEARSRDRAAAKSAAHAQTERGMLESFARKWIDLETFKSAVSAYGLDAAGWRRPTFQIRLSGERKRTRLERKELTNPDGSYRGAEYAEVERTYARPKWSTGHAYWRRNHFVVTAGSDFGDALATILHEVAHIVTPKDRGHGPQWRAVFQDAVREVTGRADLILRGSNKYDFHRAAVDAVTEWWQRTNPACAHAALALPSEAS